MQETIYITERGTITLPAKIRKELGFLGGEQLIVETTKEGEVVLKPAVTLPIEIYSEERIAEFSSDDKKLGLLLDKHSDH